MNENDLLNGALEPAQKSRSDVGVQRIMSSSGTKAVERYTMQNLPLKTMNVPGREKIDNTQLKEELARLKKALEEKGREADALKLAVDKTSKAAREEGFKAGKVEGRKEGEAASAEKYNASVNALQKNVEKVAETLVREKSELFLGFEDEALALLTGSVRKVFGQIAAWNEGAVLPLLKQAVDAMTRAQNIVVKVNPEDFRVVDESRSFWLPLHQKVEQLEIREDARVEKGSCLVDSDSTSVEMNIARILDKIEAALRKALEEHKAQARSGSGKEEPGEQAG